MITLFVYTEQDTSPRFFEAFKAIREEAGLSRVRVYPVTAAGVNNLPSDQAVLVFGKITDPTYEHTNNVYTYSPAQVLTKANSVTVVSNGIKRALGITPAYPQFPSRIHSFARDVDADVVRNLLHALHLDKEIVIDIETSGNIKTGTVDDEDVRLLTVAIYSPGQSISYVMPGGWYDREDLEEVLSDFLVSYAGKFIYHNGKFDTRVMERILGIKLRVDEDTMLMHHVLNQAARMHALKPLCQLYFGAEEWEGDLKKYTKGGGHYELVPYNLLAKYNALDVYWTYVLYEYLKAQMDVDEEAQRAYQLELAAAEFLLKVEQRGIPFDSEAADSLQAECAVEKQAELVNMQQVAGQGFNPNSPKQVKEALSKMGVEVQGTSVQIIEEAMSEQDKPSVPYKFMESLLRYRKAAKISSTYVKGWKSKERNGKVHPTFQVHGTTTGRLSSTAPNSQNVPRSKKVRAIVGIPE